MTWKCQIMSACTDHRIDGADDHDVDVRHFDPYGEDVLIMSATGSEFVGLTPRTLPAPGFVPLVCASALP